MITRRQNLKVTREKCSEALHIFDRFHIVAKMNTALDDTDTEARRGWVTR
jgi:transposase